MFLVTLKKPLTLSIVIPVYNEQHHLKRCLDAIAAQTVLPNNVIVVNNNSSDKSASVAKKYPFVTVIDESKQGIVHARNTGFNAVKSDLIGRIDADTILPSDWVQRVLAFYTNPDNGDVALTGGGYFYNFRLPTLNGWLFSQLAFRFNRFVIGHYILWGSNMIMPKQMWNKVKDSVCMNDAYHEDIDLALHAHKKGYRITYDGTLRVGVKLKRVWEDRWQQSHHLKRWPNTLKEHGYSLWWMGSIGNKLLPIIGEPFFFITEGIARILNRPKLPK